MIRTLFAANIKVEIFLTEQNFIFVFLRSQSAKIKRSLFIKKFEFILFVTFFKNYANIYLLV